MACCFSLVATDLTDTPWIYFAGPSFDGSTLFTSDSSTGAVQEWDAGDQTLIRSMTVTGLDTDSSSGGTATATHLYFVNNDHLYLSRIDLSTEAVDDDWIDFGTSLVHGPTYCPADGRIYLTVDNLEVRAYDLTGTLDETIYNGGDSVVSKPLWTDDGGVWFATQNGSTYTQHRYDISAGTTATYAFPTASGFTTTWESWHTNGESVYVRGQRYTSGFAQYEYLWLQFETGSGASMEQAVNAYDVTLSTDPTTGIVTATDYPPGTSCVNAVHAFGSWDAQQDGSGVGWWQSDFGAYGRLWRFDPCPVGGLTVGFLQIG